MNHWTRSDNIKQAAINHKINTMVQYQWPDPPWAAATFLGIYGGFGWSPLELSTPSSSHLSFLQFGFLLGYEPFEALYWVVLAGFLVILRCSSAVAAAPQLLYRNTVPTTFPGLAATPAGSFVHIRVGILFFNFCWVSKVWGYLRIEGGSKSERAATLTFQVWNEDLNTILPSAIYFSMQNSPNDNIKVTPNAQGFYLCGV